MAALLTGSMLLVATTYLGYVVPWDQAALAAATVGEDLAPFSPVFGHEVRVDLVFGKVSRRTLFRLSWPGRVPDR